MNVAEKLAELRRTIPGCHVAAFVDLSARMVLAHDTRSKPPQERLDGLADRADRLLRLPGCAKLEHVVALSDENLEIFLRHSDKSDDSLALVCNLETDLDAVVSAGLDVLRGIQSDA